MRYSIWKQTSLALSIRSLSPYYSNQYYLTIIVIIIFIIKTGNQCKDIKYHNDQTHNYTWRPQYAIDIKPLVLSLQVDVLFLIYEVKEESAELVEYEKDDESLDAEVEEYEVVATEYEDVYEEEHYLVITS